MEQPCMLPILYWQYHACWCFENFRSQGISRHGIDAPKRNIPSPASEELTYAETTCDELRNLINLALSNAPRTKM